MKKKGEIKVNTISKNYRGQVWVETVIYLLIAFVMMGLVLSYVKPKIEDMRDQTIIKQSIEIIKEIDNSVTTIGSTGNKRLIEVGVKKGDFIIDSTRDFIIFEVETDYKYSESNEAIYDGNIKITTEGENQYSKVRLERDFSEEYDFIYDGSAVNKTLTKASSAYNLFIENKGVGTQPGKLVIDFSVQ